MAPNPEVSPYTVLIPIVRSQIGDLTIGVGQEDTFEFSAEDIAEEINNSFDLRIDMDFVVPDTVAIETVGDYENLTITILDTDQKKIKRELVIDSARRCLNIRLQTGTADNIDIVKRGKKISMANLVKGLQEAMAVADKLYTQYTFSQMTGRALVASYDPDSTDLTHTAY